MTIASAEHATLRGRRIVLSMVTGLPVLGLQVVSGLLLVTLAWRALGADGFGLWAAITALAPLIALGDLGVGSALVSVVATAMGRDDGAAARRGAAMTIVLLTGMALLLAAALLLACDRVDWVAWFKLPRQTPYAPALALASYAACRLLLLPLGVVAKLRTGLQENFVNNAWDATGVCLSLILFYLASSAGAGLPMLLLASGTGPVLAALGNWLGLVGRDVIPRPGDLELGQLLPLLHLGLLFLALNLSTILSSAADNLVAIRLLGTAATAELAVTNKIFTVGQAALGVALMPLWPAFAEAIARRDGRWIRRTLRLSLAATCGSALLLAAIFLLGANRAVVLWLGPDATLSTDILWANAAWLVLQAAGIVGAMFLNGARVMRFQIILALGFGGLAFGLKFLLASELGAAGIVWATCIAYAAMVLPSYAWFIRRWLARADWA